MGNCLTTGKKLYEIRIGDITITDQTAKEYFLYCYQHPDTTWFYQYSEFKAEIEKQKKESLEREKKIMAKLAKAKNHADTLKAYQYDISLVPIGSFLRAMSEQESYLSNHNIGRVDKNEDLGEQIEHYTGYLTKHEPTAQDFSVWYIKQGAKPN